MSTRLINEYAELAAAVGNMLEQQTAASVMEVHEVLRRHARRAEIEAQHFFTRVVQPLIHSPSVLEVWAEQTAQQIMETTKCPHCNGFGNILLTFQAVPESGPQMHKCNACGGTGKKLT